MLFPSLNGLSTASPAVKTSQSRDFSQFLRFKGNGQETATASTDKNSHAKDFINDFSHKLNTFYQMIVEVPAGTLERWRVKGHQLIQDVEKGKPRVLNCLPPSFNYGVVPQTLQSKETNGDGDPLDAMVLSASHPKGEPLSFKLIGALDIYDEGERATKLIGLDKKGPFKEINNIEELDLKYPGVLKLLKGWLKNYKGTNKIFIKGTLSKQEAEVRIDECHQAWRDDIKKKFA